MIYIKSDSEIDAMRRAGRITGETLAMLEEKVKPQVTTAYLDKIAEEYIIKAGAKPSFKGLYGFPASLCISVNEEVVHGIPGSRVLQEGDIVSLDCGAYYEGFHGDATRTFPVGKISSEAQRLIDVTRQSFFEGVKCACVGNRIGDIGNAVQTYVEKNGFSVVKDYVGHGIGRKMHEEPSVPNYGKKSRGPKLVKGMAIAIEPMVNAGDYRVKELNNGWTVVTLDGKPSAHYENTLVILDNGPEILTLI